MNLLCVLYISSVQFSVYNTNRYIVMYSSGLSGVSTPPNDVLIYYCLV